MNQSNALEGYQEMQALNQQLQVLQNQLELLDNQVNELNTVKDTLKNIEESQGNEELLVPLGAGIFVKGDMKGKEKIIMNVGSNVVVEKNTKEAMDVVDAQIIEMAKIKEAIEKDTQDLMMDLQKLQLSMKK